MRKLTLGVVLVGMSSGAFVACDGDDGAGNSNPNGVATGADEAVNARDCFVGLALPGVSYSGYACSGTSDISSVSALGPSSWDDVRISIDLALGAPPAIGPLELESLTIRIPNGEASTLDWDAPVDSCTATAVKSAVEEDFGWIYYRIDIACTQPATPAANNSEAPMELGNFSIVTFFKQ